jgi:hypothetical protein
LFLGSAGLQVLGIEGWVLIVLTGVLIVWVAGALVWWFFQLRDSNNQIQWLEQELAWARGLRHEPLEEPKDFSKGRLVIYGGLAIAAIGAVTSLLQLLMSD